MNNFKTIWMFLDGWDFHSHKPLYHFMCFCAYSQVEVIYSKAHLLFQSLAHCGKVFHLEDSG
jgi:hypothetical protein